MSALTANQLWYGTDRQPAPAYELRAGPVTALLDGIDVRYVRIGSLELVRRIYVAARDQNWNTIPAQYHITRLEQRQESFDVEFDVEHRSHNLDFSWHGQIRGIADGQIRYEMDGVAKSDFRYNRIGFCILHPFHECAGKPYRAQAPQGEVSGYLPKLIGQQRFENGVYVPLFPSFSKLVIDIEEGIQVRMDFEGDLLEMEDQRNWTDASFKTYCTPLSRGFPHLARAGMGITQSFTVSIMSTGEAAQEAGQAEEMPRLSLGPATGRSLPTIGFGLNSDGAALSAREIELVRALSPDHMRVEVHLSSGYSAALERAIATSRALDCALEIAVFLTEETASELERVASLLQGSARVARFLIFQEGAQTAHPSETTAPRLVSLARERLRDAVPQAAFIGGTDMYFCELNRTRPQVEVMDGISYTILPQQHAFDERSIVETLEAQAETVKSAQAFSGSRPLIISPITLKRRYNPHATAAEAEHAPDELPDAVDPRQMSLFGAVWTAGSVKYLAESGAASLTYYETTGWLGLMEREAGSPLRNLFPSTPGMVFPLYHVFADVAQWKGGSLVECRSNRPLVAAALAVEYTGKLHLLVVNLTGAAQRVVLGPLAAEQVWLRSLDAGTAQEAMFEPERFRQRIHQVIVQDGQLTLDLEPYATVHIDA